MERASTIEIVATWPCGLQQTWRVPLNLFPMHDFVPPYACVAGTTSVHGTLVIPPYKFFVDHGVLIRQFLDGWYTTAAGSVLLADWPFAAALLTPRIELKTMV